VKLNLTIGSVHGGGSLDDDEDNNSTIDGNDDADADGLLNVEIVSLNADSVEGGGSVPLPELSLERCESAIHRVCCLGLASGISKQLSRTTISLKTLRDLLCGVG